MNLMGDLPQKVKRINDIVHQANADIFNIWLNEMLFKWHWWLEFSLAVCSWTLWIILRRKESTARLLFAGSIAVILSSFFDAIGMAMGLWGYNSKLIPLIPPYVTWDFCLIPVGIMLTLQYFPKANPLIKGMIISGIGTFIAQPLYRWIGIYASYYWKDYYSFPISVGIYLISHYAFTRKTFDKIV